MNSKNKKHLLYFIPLIFLAVVTFYPAYKFYETFHAYGFSTKNQDWANAGSFFGGIYSAIFTFISLIVLSATLILTKKYNNQQLEILLTSQRKNEFCSLFDKLTKKMDAINYMDMGLRNEQQYFFINEQRLFRDIDSIRKDDNVSYGTILDLSVNLLGGEWYENTKPYYDVFLITTEILNMLDKAPEDDKRFMLAYMEANSSTNRLYWLFCFMRGNDEKCEEILTRNPRALRVPKGYI